MPSWGEITKEADEVREIMITDAGRGKKLFNKLIRKYPNDGMIYFKRGEAWEHLEKLDHAANDYNKAVKLFPKDTWKKKATINHNRVILKEQKSSKTPPAVKKKSKKQKTNVGSTDILRLVLNKYFGHESFRNHQKAIIEDILAGKDVLAVMPTGGGKSLIYELPPIILNGRTIVVSPLKSLMKDQQDKIRKIGLKYAFINSTLSKDQISKRIKDFLKGKIRLLYVAPERFRPDFMNELKGESIDLFAIDEAHCISEWGHEFRRAYIRLKEVILNLNPRSVAAVTATATPKVRKDIKRLLGRPKMEIYIERLDRPELMFSVVPVMAERDDILRMKKVSELIYERKGSAIVYVRTKKDADRLALYLKRSGLKAISYHADIEDKLKEKAHKEWKKGRVHVVVATVAFGMGIDKKDVRTIISYMMADSLERFYQEVGRAGRDGEKADCILLNHHEDEKFQDWIVEEKDPNEDEIKMVLKRLQIHRRIKETQFGPKFPMLRILNLLIEQGFLREDPNSPEWYLPCGEIPDIGMLDRSRLNEPKKNDIKKLDAMKLFTKTKKCRTAVILKYFGEKTPRNYKCNHCDNCLNA